MRQNYIEFIGCHIRADAIALIGPVLLQQNENEYYFNIYVAGVEKPFVFISPKKDDCDNWRKSLIEQVGQCETLQ